MLRNMKCPSDMKLLRNEVKFAIMCEAHFIREAYFILRSRTSLARRANFIEKSTCFRKCFFLVGEDGFEPSKRNAADLQSVPFGHSGTPPYELAAWSR